MGDRAWAGTQARPGKGKVLSGDTLASMRTNFPVSFPVFPNPSLSLAPSAPKCPPTPVGVPVSHCCLKLSLQFPSPGLTSWPSLAGVRTASSVRVAAGTGAS